MKTTLLILSFLVSVTAAGQKSLDKEYLRKVVGNLQKIESATYNELTESWQPGDTVASFIRTNYVQEYDNPADTTIGACYATFEVANGTQFVYGYNGHLKASVYEEHKGVLLDDFTTRVLPFRLVGPPFFNYTRNILQYALTTTDNTELVLNDEGDHYFFRLTINESRQVEFFGKAYYIPESPYCWDPTSVYELWISKRDDLPYKFRREMSHDVSVHTCVDVTFNTLSLKDFDLYAYFPEGYEIRKRWETEKAPASTKPAMEGEQAPLWTLNDTDGTPVSLANQKSKVLLLNFTGIGCGPCAAAIPFLKTLKERFPADSFDLISIESWSGNPRTIKFYSDKNKLNYRMLNATKEVVEQYKTGNAAPFFMILDEQRVIRKVIQGYSEGRTDEEIIKAIQGLL